MLNILLPKKNQKVFYDRVANDEHQRISLLAWTGKIDYCRSNGVGHQEDIYLDIPFNLLTIILIQMKLHMVAN